jgi:RNA polymerase sigma-B factor
VLATEDARFARVARASVGRRVLVTSVLAHPSTRRRRATCTLDRLTAARHRARAALTVPRVPVARRWLAARAARPAVDRELWTRHVAYADRHDPRDLDVLVERYSGFATATARRHYRHGEPVDDLVQVSHEALMLALHRFDPERRTPFLAYATPTIVGTLRRHFRDAGWALRVPREVHELARPQRDAIDLLTQDLGRSPTLAEVADLMGVPFERLVAVEQARRARSTASIDGLGVTTSALVEADDSSAAGTAGVENRMALHRGLARLDDADVRLLTWYYFEEQTQSQIAQRLGVSQMQVSRLLARAVQRLRPFLSSSL